MAPTEVSKPALTIARQLVEGLPEGHPLSFFVFASTVEKMVEFTPERKPVLEQIDALLSGKVLKIFGRTSLWDSVIDALKSLGTPHTGDAIYAITDGGDNQSHANLADVEKTLVTAGVRFFAILPPPPRGPFSSEEDRGPRELNELAQRTGGFLLISYATRFGGSPVPIDSDQLKAELELLYNWTFNFYRIEIQPVEPLDKMRDWQLQLLNPRNTGEPNRVLGYPKKLAPCPGHGSSRSPR